MTRILLASFLAATGLTVTTADTAMSGQVSEDQDGSASVKPSLAAGSTPIALDECGATAPPFALEDQFGTTHTYSFPKAKVSVLLFADKEGSKQVKSWVVPLYERYEDTIDVDGVADLHAVPAFLRSTLRFFFKHNTNRPILLDWDGSVTKQFKCEAGCVNLFVVSKTGAIRTTSVGLPDERKRQQVFTTVDGLLDTSSKH